MNDFQPLDLGLVGNGRVAALVNPLGRIVWWCYPRFDSNPVFSRLVAGDEEKGFTDVVLDGQVRTESSYERNSAIIRTELHDDQGNAVRITDFAPRFKMYGRNFRPAQIMRIIEPIAGLPRVTIRVRPTFDYGLESKGRAGSNHIRYKLGHDSMRVTTDASLSYVQDETAFALMRPVTLVFGPDESFNDAPDATARDFLDRTLSYWRDWVRALAVPFEWQTAVIRSAITLKLCSFEETGAIVAAHTTSVSEAPDSERNWDYRYCWLRDAYFVVQALNRLGATRTMEGYIDYIATVAAGAAKDIKPLYGVVPNAPLEERVAENLAGFQGQAPVRVGNQAAEQNQHDVYGSIVLAVMQSFMDQRLPNLGDEGLFRRLEPLGELAAQLAFEPDAGIWEYRGRRRVHTHSAILCWVACDRLSRISHGLDLDGDSSRWRQEADKIRERILTECWSESRQAFTAAIGTEDLDASVLLMHDLGIIEAQDPRFISTVECIGRELNRNGHMLRYAAADDFGEPETAFLVIKFWYLDALASIGREDEARTLFESLLASRNRYGLLSEDLHPETGALWGNIPQTYSMAGIVQSAMRLSKSWEEGTWLGSS
ncbi:MAG: glycoside hydrolase family 15 protein [Burkholderiaceae bacterium]